VVVGLRLGDATWVDVRDPAPSVALLPVGSTEQHGPHAPLSTDAVVAESVAEEADARSEHPTVVLPTVPVGISKEHDGFEGTLHVSPSAFRSYVAETALSSPADTVVFVNGHGGNTDALGEVSARLTRDHEDIFATHWTWWKAVDTDELGMGHAGPVETSVLLYLVPELVGEAVEGADSWGEYAETAPLAYDTDEFTENGVVGDAREATAEKGERLYEDAVASLVRLVDRLVSG